MNCKLNLNFFTVCQIILIGCISGAWLLPVPVYAGKLTFELHSKDVRIVAREGGQTVTVQDGTIMEIPGVPVLPERTVWVLLPSDADENTVALEVLDMDSETLTEKLDIPPVPPAVSVSGQTVWWGNQKNIQDGRDVDVYTKNAEFPGSVLAMDHVSRRRDRQLARLTFFPVQYNPVTGEARHISRVEFQLSYQTAGAKEKILSGKSAEQFDLALPSPVLNAEAPAGGSMDSDLETKNLAGTGYAVVTTDAVLAALYTPGPGAALHDFAVHKTGLGFSVYLVTQTQTVSHSAGPAGSGYGTDAGQQRAVNIRQWLQANHGSTEKSIKYVLLIGDPDPEDTTAPSDTFGDVPMLLCWPKITGNQWASTPETPTDYFFADLTGNWDLNGNGVYGEYPEDRGTGGIDFLPEVLVGRIPFSDTTVIAGILEKTMDYENVTYTAGDNTALAWRKKALLPMSILSFGTSWYGCSNDISFTDEAWLGVSSQEHVLHPNGFDTFLLTEQEGDPNYPDPGWGAVSKIIGDAPLYKTTGESSGNILEHWWNAADHWGIVFWSLHGSATAVSRKNWTRVNPVYCPHFDSYFWRTHSAGLDDNRPAFLVSTACNIGHPEHSDAHGLSLGRELIKNGTLVALANSREAWYTGGHFSDADDGFLPRVTEHTSDIRATVYYYARELARDAAAGDALFYARQSKNAMVQMAWANNFVSNIYGDPSVKILPPGFSGTDTDQDGLSDDEEIFIYLSDPDKADTDSDGLKDNEELTAHKGRWQTDLDQDSLNIFHDPDSDGDGLDDYLEARVLLTDPGNPDTDGDGLSDYDEINRDGDPGAYAEGIDTDPHNPDTDGDGVNDGDEVLQGFNPVDPWDNRATADAGPDQTVSADPDGSTEVILDGSGSFDPNGDPLYFYWNLESSISEYTSIVPRNGNAPAPVLTAAVGGNYLISLKVREDLDNWVWSEMDHVTIHVAHFISGTAPESATWGDELTITGAGFDRNIADNTVTVGGIAAQVVSAEHNELCIIIPDGCSSGEVVVTVNGRACVPASFHLAAPAGSFSSAPAENLPLLSDCSQAAVFGDVDNDGDLDLVVANMGGLDTAVKNYDDPACAAMNPQNRLYINNGQGRFADMTFGPDQVQGTADDRLPVDDDQSVDVLLADLDGDGDLDMVVANQGAFIESHEFCGYGELYTCTGGGEQNRIYINDGTGKFTDETGTRLPAATDVTHDILLADVDGDGDLDIYVGNGKACIPHTGEKYPCQDYCCEMYCQECQGFNCGQACCTSCGEENCEWIWFEDGCENHPDNPCCNGFCDSCGEIEYLCYECCGGEGECDGFNCSSCCSDCSECPDNPGCQDRSEPVPAKDRLYLNDGAGYFVAAAGDILVTDQGRNDNYGRTRSVAAADLDNDGVLDLLRDGDTRNYNRLYRFEKTGSQFVRVGQMAYKSNIKAILTADFDNSGDGLLDVFAPVYATSGDYPAYLIQTTADSFEDHGGYNDWIPAGFKYYDLKQIVSGAAADVNLDGLPDIVLGRSGGYANYLFINDDTQPGHLTHTAGLLPEITAGSYGTALGDVDNDGDPDLLFANSGQNVLLINNTIVSISCAWDLEGSDNDVDGLDLSAFIQAGDLTDLSGFAANFGK